MEHSILLNNGQPVEQALGLLNRAISILDSENLPIAAAKVDEARCAIRHASARIDDRYTADTFPAELS